MTASQLDTPSVGWRHELLSLPDAFAEVRQRWWIPLAAAAAGFAIMALYAMAATPLYRSETLAAPVNLDQELGGQLGSTGGAGLSGLARLAGATSENTRQTEALAMLSSRAFALDLIRRLDLAPLLFKDRWDASARRWKPAEQPGFLKSWLKSWFAVYRAMPRRTSAAPTEDELFEAYRERTKFVAAEEGGLLTVTIEAENPEVAQRWAAASIAQVNERIRLQDVARARSIQSYLQSRLESTTVAELRAAVASLLELQLRRATLANTSPDYVFRVIDPANLPVAPFAPRPTLLAAIGAVLGALIATFALLLRSFSRRT